MVSKKPPMAPVGTIFEKVYLDQNLQLLRYKSTDFSPVRDWRNVVYEGPGRYGLKVEEDPVA